MSDPPPGTERPYQVDDAWSRAVFARRTGAGAAFFLRHLRPGMRLIDAAVDAAFRATGAAVYVSYFCTLARTSLPTWATRTTVSSHWPRPTP